MGNICNAQVLRIGAPEAVAWGPISAGLQMAIVGVKGTYSIGEPIIVTVAIRSRGPKLFLRTIDAASLQTTVVDSRGMRLPERPDAAADLNTTGHPVFYVDSSHTLENQLRISDRYKLSPGTYTLVISTDVYDGSTSLGSHQAPIAHLVSSKIAVNVR
jgi:hypothetical protein